MWNNFTLCHEGSIILIWEISFKTLAVLTVGTVDWRMEVRGKTSAYRQEGMSSYGHLPADVLSCEWAQVGWVSAVLIILVVFVL